MGKAIVYTAVTGAAALISGLWFALDRGQPALLLCIASVLAICIAGPVLLRKDFQFVGIPGVVEIFFALGALGLAIYAGLKRSEHWFWAGILAQTLPTFRISLVSLKAYQRPMSLKVSVGACLAGLIGLNIYLGIAHSAWVGDTSVALVKEWFPDAVAPKPATPPPPPAPKGPAVPAVVDKNPPVAIIAGRPLTLEIVEYQRYIDSLIDEKMDRNDAIAALLQAYTSRAILEKKFKTFDPAMLKDEQQWVMNRVSDSKIIRKIRAHKTDELFLDVYVGANGLYKRKLGEIFEKRKNEEFKKRAVEVLKEVAAADGVERPGPKVDAVAKDECRYSLVKREFVVKYADDEVPTQPDPKDTLAPKLAALKVNTTLPEVLWGDMNGLVIRRVLDDFKGRAVYEVYRIVESGVYTSWFKKQCADMVIEIPDPVLRNTMLDMAKDVNHIIKTK
ncbi:MAG TPA: hypothetical protein VFS19_06920 [Planctomycetota bacterium]|nr:hypothetical protein [Planctomycetota bacterium]